MAHEVSQKATFTMDVTDMVQIMFSNQILKNHEGQTQAEANARTAQKQLEETENLAQEEERKAREQREEVERQAREIREQQAKLNKAANDLNESKYAFSAARFFSFGLATNSTEAEQIKIDAAKTALE